MSLDTPIVPAPVPSEPARKTPVLAIVIGVLLVLAVVATVAVVLVRQALGTGVDSAEVMPADTAVYINFDLLDVRDDLRVDRFVRTFPALFEDAELGDGTVDGFVDEFDASLRDELGVDFSNDVLPWIGRTAGLGVSNVDLAAEEADVLFAIVVRDGGEADEFVEKVLVEATNRGASIVEGRHRDVPFREITTEDEDLLYVARSGDALMIASSLRSLQNGIETQQGAMPSLSADESFQEAFAQVPEDAFVTAYVGSELFAGFARTFEEQMAGADMDAAVETFEGYEYVIVSTSITDAGVQFDAAVALDPEASSQAGLGTTVSESSYVPLLPADTTAFVAAASGPADWDEIQAEFEEQLGGDLEAMLDNVEQVVGFDPLDDLLRYLTGDVAIAMTTAADGALAEQGGFDVGVLLAAKVSDAAPMERTIGRFVEFLNEQQVPVSVSEHPEGTWYAIAEQGSEFVRFGMDGDSLVIASGEGAASSLGADGAKLVDTETFQEVRTALPDGPLVMYADIQGIMDQFRVAGDVRLDLEPLRAVGATQSSGPDGGRATLLVVIDWVEG